MTAQLAAIGAGLFIKGTLARILSKDIDFPFAFGNVQIVNGQAVASEDIQALDKGDPESGRKIAEESAKQLNAALQALDLPPEQLQQINSPPITVGVIAGDRPGNVGKRGLFFGVQEPIPKGKPGHGFLAGVKAQDQGFDTLDEMLNSLTKFTFEEITDPKDRFQGQLAPAPETVRQTIEAAGGPEAAAAAVSAGTGLDIEIPQKFKANNIFQKIGKAAQIAGIAIGVAGVGNIAAQAGTAAAQAGTTTATGDIVGKGILATGGVPTGSTALVPSLAPGLTSATNSAFALGSAGGAGVTSLGSTAASLGTSAFSNAGTSIGRAASGAVNPTFSSGITGGGTAGGTTGGGTVARTFGDRLLDVGQQAVGSAVGGLVGRGLEELLGPSNKGVTQPLIDALRQAQQTPLISAGGLQTDRVNGRLTVTPLSQRTSAVDNLVGQFGESAAEFGDLRGQVTPGFGRLTDAIDTSAQSRLQDLESTRLRSIGNLRENLQRRRVSGSSFASDTLARADREFQVERDKILADAGQQRATAFLQELELNSQLLQREQQQKQAQFITQLEQLNLETELATKLATAGQDLFGQLSGLLANVNQLELLGRGQFISGFAGIGREAFA